MGKNADSGGGYRGWAALCCALWAVVSISVDPPAANSFCQVSAWGASAGSPAKESNVSGRSMKSHVNYYTRTYGAADPDTFPLVHKAHKIFERVRAAADKRSNRLPKLQIVNSDGEPWAVALPDGFIVLSTHALQICYADVSEMEGDARLAFLLGHELGHMAQDDFWHMEIYMAMSTDPDCAGLRDILDQASDVPGADYHRRLVALQAKEMKADDAGFIYAAIAGYRVDMLLKKPGEKRDFFHEWVHRISHSQKAHADSGHSSPGQRVSMLRSRLANLREALEFFMFGVRLAYFGRYEDAVYFFREFQKVFPSREVFNNLGYCYLQIAIREMPFSAAHNYWLPTVVDAYSRSESLVRIRGAEPSEQIPASARPLLEEAEALFKQACKSDPLYAPCRVNLAVTYFYLGDIYKARATVEDALKLAPENREIEMLRALIVSRESLVADTGASGIKMLQALCAKTDALAPALYNLAVLLEKRGRTGGALEIWRRLAAQLGNLPSPYRQLVAQRVSVKMPPEEGSNQTHHLFPWKLPIELGVDFIENPRAMEFLSGWKTIGFDWQKPSLAGHIHKSETGNAVLDLDGVVEMVVLVDNDLGVTDDLPGEWKLVKTETIANDALLSYRGTVDCAALVRSGRVREVWVVPAIGK